MTVYQTPSSPQSIPRAAIYCRVSDAGAKDAYGMDTQDAECRAYAEAQGWAVVAVYREWWTGAELFERPELTNVRQAMRDRAFDVLLVHRLDRLSRDVNHQGYILAEAEHAGMAWDSATEDVHGPAGTVLRAVVGALAEIDRLKIVANTTRGRNAKLAAGKPVGSGSPPYGMMWANAEKTRLVEHPITGPIVRRMFTEVANGQSVRGLCRLLDADGVQPPRHTTTRWTRSTVRHILGSRVYLGEGRWNQTEWVKPEGATRKMHRPRTPDKIITLPEGIYPAMIDPALFARVATRLARNQEDAPNFRRTRNPNVGLLRRGLAKCGVCGASLVVGRNKSVLVYRCHSDQKARGACPVGATIPIDELDAAAWAYMREVLAKPERIRRHIAFLRANDPTTYDLTGIDRQQRDLERSRANISAAIAALDDPLAAADLIGKLGLIGKQLAALDRDRADVVARQAAWQAEIDDLSDLEARCREVEEALALATEYADRRQLLQLVAVQARLFPMGSPERWVITSGVVPDVASNVANTL